MLTRRQFADKENNKIPIKEEKFLIKSPLRNGFFQKISSPIRNLSRRSSQKSQTNEPLTNPATTTAKFELLTNQFSVNEKSGTGVTEALKFTIDDEKPEQTTEAAVVESIDKQQQETKPVMQGLTINTQLAAKITPSSTLTAVSTSNSASSPAQVKTTLEKQNSHPLVKQNSDQNIKSTTGLVSFAPGVRPITKRKTKHENRARKALRTITFILGAFIFCFAPWHVVSIYNSFCPNCFDSNLYHHFFYSCYFLCYLNSPINPFMYALANQQFKKTFLRILKGDWRRL